MMTNKNLFATLEALRHDEPELFQTDSELQEAEEIRQLRSIIAEIQDSADSTYMTTT